MDRYKSVEEEKMREMIHIYRKVLITKDRKKGRYTVPPTGSRDQNFHHYPQHLGFSLLSTSLSKLQFDLYINIYKKKKTIKKEWMRR